ncbi:MAG TPA: hypothetical protein VMW17_20430 [Candidatus Binatia bacterium]|nr:hypothetical protein [Candidatus Binatia bacterium]
MIALFGHDEHSIFGVTSILDIEKIPYRRVTSLDAQPGDLVLVAGGDLSPAEVACLDGQTAVVLNGGSAFARAMLGATRATVRRRSSAIVLAQNLWPARVMQMAASFGKVSLRLPIAPVCEVEALRDAAPLAALSLQHGSQHAQAPAVARRDHCVWSAVDLGSAFANLMTEAYLPAAPARAAAPSSLRARMRRLAGHAYYGAPDFVRNWVQRRSHNLLERRLRGYGDQVSEYPVDATGWLIIELLKRLIIHAAGSLVRIERWPAPYDAAATLTHDIAPRRYAYTKGLDRLLRYIAAVGHPATVGLSAETTDRYLPESTVPRLQSQSLVCYGLDHRGTNVGGREEISIALQVARAHLERRVHTVVNGYRSPGLHRSADLAWALDQQQFRFDSSWPDVDRENFHHFGGGVRLNLPFRPGVRDVSGVLRPSRCLELPLSAPDCIESLRTGSSVAELRALVESKAAYVRQTGGLYVARVHGGVFGDRDATQREEHLGFVCRQLRQPGVWFDGMERIVDWWLAREALLLAERGTTLHLTNGAERAITGVRVVVERMDGQTVLLLPTLEAGTSVLLALPRGSTRSAAIEHTEEPAVVFPQDVSRAIH